MCGLLQKALGAMKLYAQVWPWIQAKSGRRWIWKALIRLDVGTPMDFVSGDSIRYMFLFGLFCFPDAHGFVRALGNFCRLQPVGGHGSNAGS